MAKEPLPEKGGNGTHATLCKDPKAKKFLARVGAGEAPTTVGKSLKYAPCLVQNAYKKILYPLLRMYGYKAMLRLEKAGMTQLEALRLFAKAIGHPIPPTETEMEDALRNAGLDEHRLAELIARDVEAERVKTYKDPKTGAPIEQKYPDNMMRAKMRQMAMAGLGALPAQKLEIKGKVAHIGFTIPMEKFLEMEKEFHPRMIDVEAEEE